MFFQHAKNCAKIRAARAARLFSMFRLVEVAVAVFDARTLSLEKYSARTEVGFNDVSIGTFGLASYL